MADVAADLKTWSTTASSNSPADATTVGSGLADNLQEIQKVVRQDLAHKGADIASAGTTDLGAVAGLMHDITGTTTITSFGTVGAGIWKIIKFEGALTLTYNATSMILLGGANIVTANGDVAIVMSEGSGNWRMLSWMPATLVVESGLRENALYNGAFQVWQLGGSSLSSPAATRTYLADQWYVNPAGAAVNQLRSTTVRSGARSFYSLELQGAASVTAVLVGQRLEAIDVPAVKRVVTYQAWVHNVTGGAFTPNLLIGTPGASDDFTTVTNRLTQALQSCTDAAWTQVSHTVDISGYTNIDNGLQIELQIPSGSLVAGDTVRVSEIQLAPSAVVTPITPRPFAAELALCMRFVQKSFPYGTAPAQNVTTTGAALWIVTISGANGGFYAAPLQVPMRTSPTVTTYNPSAANAQIRNNGSSADWTGTSTTVSDKYIYFTGTQDGGASAGNHTSGVHYLALARL